MQVAFKNVDEFKEFVQEFAMFAEASQIEKVLGAVETLKTKVNELMATVAETLAQVKALRTVDEGMIALLGSLQQNINDFLSGANVAPVVQEGIDAIFAEAKTETDKVAAVLLANTPHDPVETGVEHNNDPALPTDPPAEG